MSIVGGGTTVVGVVGQPIAHSLSPRLHNAWLAALGLDGVYVPFSPAADRFEAFVAGLRGGAIRGLNVTLPFKETALKAADRASPLAAAAGAANLLLFQLDGTVEADNTDGAGLFYAFQRQAPGLDLSAVPVTILGAGGAARGAVAALQAAGTRDIRIVNRTLARAEALADRFIAVTAYALEDWGQAVAGTGAVINAASAEIDGAGLDLDFSTASGAVAMDMLYRPLKTGFLAKAERQGLPIVDGLDMLIGQAIPSFAALFGAAPPSAVDARALLLDALESDA